MTQSRAISRGKVAVLRWMRLGFLGPVTAIPLASQTLGSQLTVWEPPPSP